MKLHAVIVSYKRLPMLQQTVESFLATVDVEHTWLIVDNGSPADVTDWIRESGHPAILMPKNRYPGFATNTGWAHAPADADLLMRSDNDTIWLPGWCDEMIEAFADPEVGQYGPIADGDQPWAEMPCWPVGGNSIIRRTLYDDGVRYDETPWPENYGVQEDHQMTFDVWGRGYKRVFGTRPGLIFNGIRDAEYDREVAEARRRPWEA